MSCINSVRAACVALFMFCSLSFPNWNFLLTTLLCVAMAIHVVPTGLSGVSPSGPAIPDVAIA